MQPLLFLPAEDHAVSQDDQQPPPDSDLSDRQGSPRLSRDTLLLLGALTFLIFAVALTFLFPIGGNQEATPTTAPDGATSTIIASGSPYPVGTEQGGGPYPVATQPGGAYPVATATSGVGGYPLPGDGTSVAGVDPSSPADATEQAIEATQAALDETALSLDETALAAGTATPDDAYPQPDSTAPSQPTIAVTSVRPTQAPVQPPPATAPPAPTSPPPPTQAPAQPPTNTPFPTFPPPTTAPIVTPTPETSVSPTLDPSQPAPTPDPNEPPPFPSLPTLPPLPPLVDVYSGTVRWTAGQSPIILPRDVQIAPGAQLIIEPGVEVRLDRGVSIYVDGAQLLALGTPERPVVFTGNTGSRWNGIFANPDSYVVLENTTVRGGGISGTVLAVDESELVVRSSRFTDNGGSLLVTDSKLEMRNSEIAGNDMPFGAALEAVYNRGEFATFTGNRVGGNRLSSGSPMVRFSNLSTFETLILDIQGNMIRGGDDNLVLATNGPLQGAVSCNGLIGGNKGFGLRTQTVQVAPNGVPPFDLRVDNNFIDEHVPPIIPVYLEFGLGRGATSEILLDMRNNWWGKDSGPYHPELNPLGRGDSVGVKILFQPWLEQKPDCAPDS